MRQAAQVLRSNAAENAHLMAEEMGKPTRAGAAEVQKCALGCDYYAENAERFLAPEVVKTEARKSFVTFQLLGVVLAVMPWNFPFWQVFRFAAPGLMAGNAAVLKHASNVPGCALAVEQIFRKAGFPEDLFRTLMIGSRSGGGGNRGSADPRRDIDGERFRRQCRGKQSRCTAEEDGARAWRQ
jgi:succinate-semialdehyde dehydrogenase/glutarate-semialdehyde dehydrogenase